MVLVLHRRQLQVCGAGLGETLLTRCSFLRCNRFPIDEMIEYLKKFFREDSYDEGCVTPAALA